MPRESDRNHLSDVCYMKHDILEFTGPRRPCDESKTAIMDDFDDL